MSKYENYKQYVSKFFIDGWGTQNVNIGKANSLEQEIFTNPVGDFDRMWFQGFALTYLAIEQHNTKDSYDTIDRFIQCTNYLMQQTKGVYIRNINPESVKAYLAGDKTLEASKDQVLGFVVGLFMLHRNTTGSFKKSIQEMLLKIKKDLSDKMYLLWNHEEKRFYDSAFYAVVHYYGLSTAFVYSTGNAIQKFLHRINPLFILFRASVFFALKNKKFILSLKQEWLVKLLGGRCEFSVNLNFFELLINAAVDKGEAKRIVRLLDNDNVKSLKHLNLAALYLYAIHKWNIVGKNENYYEKVLMRDYALYPEKILPNSINWDCNGIGDTTNSSINRSLNTKFDADWQKTPESSNKTIENLIKESQNQKITADSGIMYLMRLLLSAYNFTD